MPTYRAWLYLRVGAEPRDKPNQRENTRTPSPNPPLKPTPNAYNQAMKKTLTAIILATLTLTACSGANEVQSSTTTESVPVAVSPSDEPMATPSPTPEPTPTVDQINISTCNLFVRKTERLFALENASEQEIIDGFSELGDTFDLAYEAVTDKQLNALMASANYQLALWETTLLTGVNIDEASDDLVEALVEVINYCDETYDAVVGS